jgi:SAM-dependent methyltransferase
MRGQAPGACPACGFEVRAADGILDFVPSPAGNDWQDFFEGRSAAADRDTSAANDYRSPVQQSYIIEGFRRACGAVAPTADVLDLGCGNGMFARALFGDRHVIGVDYSQGMCRLARDRGLEVYRADATALPFADGQFDLIYSAEILQCVNDLPALVAEAARVCRADGRFVVSTLNRASLFRQGMRMLRKVRPHPNAPTRTPAILRRAAEIAAIGRGVGLEVAATVWVHFPLPWMRRTRSAGNALEWLATNMIIAFVKSGRREA